MEATLDKLVTETAWLHRLAMSLVKDAATADDLVQDTFVTAAAHAPTDRPLRPWLARVLVNLVRMRARSGKRRAARELAVGTLAAEPSRPDELVAQIETQRMLAGLVLLLAPQRRDVVLLHYFDGLTSVEIGRRLGIPEGTVRWRLKQALDELRERLEARAPNRAWVAPLAGLARQARPAGFTIGQILVAAAALLLVASLVALRWMATPRLAEPVARGDGHAIAAAVPAIEPVVPTLVAGRSGVGSPRTGVAITGRVLDGGVAVEGAAVELATDCRFAVDDPPLVHTAADGSFAIAVDTGTQFCRYRLYAASGGRDARALLEDDPVAPVVLALEASPSLAVTVLDEVTGAPLAGAELAVVDLRNRRQPGVVTDHSGAARLALGTAAQVRIVHPGHLVKTIDLDATWTHRSIALVQTIRLAAGLELTGHVVDPAGAPIAGARVLIAGDNDDVRTRSFSVVERTDPAGAFRTAVPVRGTYAVATWEWTRDGVTSWGEDETTVEVRDTADLTITLVPTQFTHDLDIVVLDAHDRPAPGAEVASLRHAFRPGVTDATGHFVVPHFFPGCLKCGTSYIDAVAHLGALASQVVQHEATSGVVTLRLQPKGIAGVVIDDAGRPVRDAVVTISAGHGRDDCCGAISVHADVDRLGRFAFDVPGGSYLLSVRHEADDPFDDGDPVEVAGGSLDVRLVLR